MDLTMGKHTVVCFDKVFEYSVPRDEAAEMVVPDTMPDIERILCADGMIVIRSKEAGAGSVSVSAGIAANVMYVPEDGRGVRTLNIAMPVSVTADAPKVTPDSVPVASLTISSIEARMLNPRKVVVRANLAVVLECYDRVESEYYDAIPAEGCSDIETLMASETVSPVVCVREKTFVVSDEYRLPVGKPPVGEMLRHSVSLFTDEIKSVGSKVVIKGAVKVGVVYTASESGDLVSADFETSFSQLIETEGELTSPECAVTMLMTAEYIEPSTLSGGERGISCELHIVAQMVCTDSIGTEFITDCYSNKRELQATRSSRQMKCVCRRASMRGTAHEQIEAPQSVRDVRFVSCRVGDMAADGGRVRGAVNAEIVYCDDSGCVYCMTRRFTVESGTELETGTSMTVLGARCSEVYAIPSGRSIDVRICVDIEALITRNVTVSQITGLSCGENEAPAAERPSLTVLRASDGMTLWELGKKYHSTREAIRSANDLEDGDEISGKILLIPCVK